MDADIARSVRADRLFKVWPGVYVDMRKSRARDELLRLRVVAAARSCSEPRPDYEWEGRLAGEFDGLVKYGGGSMTPGQAPSDVVIAKKIREDRLRQM